MEHLPYARASVVALALRCLLPGASSALSVQCVGPSRRRPSERRCTKCPATAARRGPDTTECAGRTYGGADHERRERRVQFRRNSAGHLFGRRREPCPRGRDRDSHGRSREPRERGPHASGTAAQKPAEEITVTAQRLNQARDNIEPNTGASTYGFTSQTIENMPGGENAPLNQVLLQAPGVDQDSLADGTLHVRNEHLNVQYRIDGVVLPEGLSFFGQGLSPRFIGSMSLVTGALPAEYVSTAGIVDIQSKSGIF